jgi:hypothetical protein
MNERRKHFRATWLDDFGEVIIDGKKVIRVINKEYIDEFKKVLKTGFFEELTKRNLFLPFRVIEKPDYIHIETDFVFPLIYPYEWTFSMLKKAALVVLEIFEIAKNYHIRMKDCHPYNLLPVGHDILYVDFGTFFGGGYIELPILEFIESYYFPLYCLSWGLYETTKSFLSKKSKIPITEFYIIKYPLFRKFDSKIMKKIITYKNMLSILDLIDKQELELRIKEKFYRNNKSLYLLLKFVLNLLKTWNPFKLNLQKIKEEIQEMELNISTEWENYYGGEYKLTNRFKKILNYTRRYCSDAKTAISFGGNCGFFENELLNQTQLELVIVQDNDPKALDLGYKKFSNRGDKKRIFFMEYDFLRPVILPHTLPIYSRVKSDIVYALALTHHLVLKEGFKFDNIMEQFKMYTNKYVFIEFMPLGLWVPGKDVDVPSWYKEDLFRKEFEKHFEILKREKIEDNRILYVGKLKGV